jgi:beta-glucosidase
MSNERFRDTSLSTTERVADLVGQLSVEEKISQMLHGSPAIERLGIPEYNWWNECLHGVGRAGVATVFPQAIGIAATWDVPLMHGIATAVSDEARAKHHEAIRNGRHDQYFGLTYWTPNINIFRDPRWGRGQETYGECPYLTERLGVTFVKALQGDDPNHLKLVATPKHYAVHSGPEATRHGFDAIVGEQDLRETYLPAFRATVIEAGAMSIMGAYNRMNGEACNASPRLLQTLLRDEWGFEGFVVSDCGAIKDIWAHHKIVETPEEAAALSVKNGCELNCGCTYEALVKAHQDGLIDDETIDLAVTRLFTARIKLGMFDPPETVSYAAIPPSVVDSPKHRELALRTARESIVLLKNNGVLPLDGVNRIAVIGPNAHNPEVLCGNYQGVPARSVTPLEAIRERLGPDAYVPYTMGCDHLTKMDVDLDNVAALSREAEVVVACVGLSPLFEGEEGYSVGDREGLELPGVQEDMLKRVKAEGTPLIVVYLGGSATALEWANDNADAVLAAWYPGQTGGTAIADVIFGDYNPSGRLPVTFYRTLDDLPPFEDYSMIGRTYRFFEGEPLWPFGYGLSYTTFEYTDARVTPDAIVTDAEMSVTVSATVRNTGEVAGDEVVQLYMKHAAPPHRTPIRQLVGFERVTLQPGESVSVSFDIPAERLAQITEDGDRMIEPGKVYVSVGGGQVSVDTSCDMTAFNITGSSVHLPW